MGVDDEDSQPCLEQGVILQEVSNTLGYHEVMNRRDVFRVMFSSIEKAEFVVLTRVSRGSFGLFFF
jgi:hypothetical protein